MELIDKNSLLEKLSYLLPQPTDNSAKLKKLYYFILKEIENQPVIEIGEKE